MRIALAIVVSLIWVQSTNGNFALAQSSMNRMLLGKWVFEWKDGNVDYIIFKKGATFDMYSYEIENNYYGHFHTSKDTIVMNCDSVRYTEGRGNVKETFKFVFSGTSLRQVYARYGMSNPITSFDSTYSFHRAKMKDMKHKLE